MGQRGGSASLKTMVGESPKAQDIRRQSRILRNRVPPLTRCGNLPSRFASSRLTLPNTATSYGRGGGVGRGLGEAVPLGVGVGLGVFVGVGVAVAVPVGDAVGVGVGEPPPAKLNLPTRVCQLKLPVTASYSFTCQKLVPSAGSTVVML